VWQKELATEKRPLHSRAGIDLYGAQSDSRYWYDLNDESSLGRTALRAAFIKGSVAVVKALLDSGADIRITDKHGWTLVKAASHNGHIEVTKLLLKEGADITIPNNNGWTQSMRH
jgi:ankyrin repeat protein